AQQLQPGGQPGPQGQPQRRIQRAWVPVGEVPVGAVVMLSEHRAGDSAGGMAADVSDLGCGHVDVEPSGATQPVAEIDILEVHEISGVEPADGLEGGPAQQQARPGQPLRGPFTQRGVGLAVRCRPRIVRPEGTEHRMPGAAAQGRQQPRGRVDLPIRLADQRPQCTRPGPSLRGREQVVEATGVPFDVRIGHRYPAHFGSPLGDTPVSGRAVSDVLPDPQQLHTVAVGRALRRSVGGPVVGQQYPHRSAGGLDDRIQERFQRVARRVGDRDDRQFLTVGVTGGHGARFCPPAHGTRLPAPPRTGVPAPPWRAVHLTVPARLTGGVPALLCCPYEDTDTSWRLRLARYRIGRRATVSRMAVRSAWSGRSWAGTYLPCRFYRLLADDRPVNPYGVSL